MSKHIRDIPISLIPLILLSFQTMNVDHSDLEVAIKQVVANLHGVEELYPGQLALLNQLFQDDNIFYTSSTNSGKTLPTVIFPDVIKKLNVMGYSFPLKPKVLFLTALNSIQLSLMVTLKNLGIICDSMNSENADTLLSSDISVLFISPETLKVHEVTKALLQFRSDFVLKVVDEAHLGI